MVKKLLSITLISLIFVSLMCVNVFAAPKTVEVEVFKQDFESSGSAYNGAVAGGISYPTYHYGDAGSGSSVFVNGETDNYVSFNTKTSNSISGGRGKIYIDQSVLEEGATYKLYAEVTFVSTQNDVTTTMIRFGSMINNSAATNPSNFDGNITITKDVPTVVASKAFVYDKSVYTASMDALVYWTAPHSGRNIDNLYVDDVRLVKVVTINDADNNFTSDVDAGYYAQAPDAGEKEGVIVFGTETIDGVNEASKYGMWVYIKNGEEEKVILESGDITTYKDAEGKFFATVTNIPKENFDDIVIAMPYIVIGNEAIFGQAITFTVNQGNKWLGTK